MKREMLWYGFSATEGITVRVSLSCRSLPAAGNKSKRHCLFCSCILAGLAGIYSIN